MFRSGREENRLHEVDRHFMKKLLISRSGYSIREKELLSKSVVPVVKYKVAS